MLVVNEPLQGDPIFYRFCKTLSMSMSISILVGCGSSATQFEKGNIDCEGLTSLQDTGMTSVCVGQELRESGYTQAMLDEIEDSVQDG